MKRGIFRIIAGIIMISLQLLSMMALTSAGVDYTSSDVGYNIGFYSIGIVGIVLLIFGINAYKKGLRSHLMLHAKSSRFHTVIKWVMFVITTLVCVNYSIAFIQNFDNFNIYMLFMALATLSFAVYLLFYIYKKPSCLPSACFVFMGVAYLYLILNNIPYYLVYTSEYDFWPVMLIFSIVPRLIAGISYIVLASKLYKENFSVKTVKAIGIIAFAMEISNNIVYPFLVFYASADILHILFVTELFLYISVFRINTLKNMTINEKTNAIRFCRKCGTALPDNAKFCNKCGTEVIDDMPSFDEDNNKENE